MLQCPPLTRHPRRVLSPTSLMEEMEMDMDEMEMEMEMDMNEMKRLFLIMIVMTDEG